VRSAEKDISLFLEEHRTPMVGREGPQATKLRRIWLFIIAITLHNFPEGMAVGVGFAGGNISNGVTLAVGIGLQNIPEGLAVAAALVATNYSKLTAFTVASWAGLVEPISGVIGSGALWMAEPLMPWILGFAAGAMLFIISDEIIPETHRRSFETHATFALIAGFVIMMFLDATLA
jgi:ZIP family zinc transporter